MGAVRRTGALGPGAGGPGAPAGSRLAEALAQARIIGAGLKHDERDGTVRAGAEDRLEVELGLEPVQRWVAAAPGPELVGDGRDQWIGDIDVEGGLQGRMDMDPHGGFPAR